jgi:hypothetical protein
MVEHSAAKKSETGSPEHLAFQHFQPVHLSLDLAIIPHVDKCGLNGQLIPT